TPNERQFAISGDWALGADPLQWILYQRRSRSEGDRAPWRAVSFVGSTRAILERCLREKGCSELVREVLLAGLPPTFDEWLTTRQATSSLPVSDPDSSTDGGAPLPAANPVKND